MLNREIRRWYYSLDSHLPYYNGVDVSEHSETNHCIQDPNANRVDRFIEMNLVSNLELTELFPTQCFIDSISNFEVDGTVNQRSNTYQQENTC